MRISEEHKRTITVSFSEEDNKKLIDMLYFLEDIVATISANDNDVIKFPEDEWEDEFTISGKDFNRIIFQFQNLLESYMIKDDDFFVDLDKEDNYD